MIQLGTESENYEAGKLVDNWADFIDWQKRQAADGAFLVDLLKDYKDPLILDVCVGDGCDAVFLLKQGYRVCGNEVDSTFRAKALANIKREGLSLDISNLDWRELYKHYKPESFDVITCIGNSLTYLFGSEHQLAALQQFKGLLKPGGMLVVDERNYQYILGNREAILRGEFRYKGVNTYRGNLVHGFPIEISEQRVTVEYSRDDGGVIGRLSFYPFKQGELKNLLAEAGFVDIRQWSDHAAGLDTNCDFLQYAAKKSA